MRLLELYLRSRSAFYGAIYLIGVALLGWMAANLLIIQLSYGEKPYMILIPVLLFAPLASACIIGTSIRSPFGDVERTSCCPLPILRFLHLAGLLALSSLTLLFASSSWSFLYAELTLMRNLLGFAGLVFLTARVLDSSLSWTIPLAYVSLVQLTGRNSQGEPFWWAWPLHSVTHMPSAALALTTLIAGLVVVCLSGSQEPPEDLQ